MTNGASVCVIVPAYNEQDYITDTLRALFVAIDRLERAGAQVEVIVVDNESTDETVERALRFPVRVVTEKRRQIAAVRNRGAREARGDFLAFLDADSHPSPNALRTIWTRLRRGRCAGGGVRIYPEYFTLRTLPLVVLVPMVQMLYGVSAGMIFATREAFEAVGGFDEGAYAGEDLDFVLRLKAWALARGLEFANLGNVHITTSVRKFEKAPLADFLIFPRYFFDKKSIANPEHCRLWYDGNHR